MAGHRRTAAPWSLARGANVLRAGGVRFSVWAPNAARVSVHLRSGAAAGTHPLSRAEHGVFEGIIPGARAGDDYGYVPDGERELPDPVSRFQPAGVHGPSRIVDPESFAWTDAGWGGLAMPDFVIYELHVGTFTDGGTFDDVIPHLRALRDLGVTAIELMPVAQFPGTRNWGYDGVDLYAPQNSYGGPEALKRLVNAAHHAKLAVVLDVVYNHLGPEGNYLGALGPYFGERYRTPWGEPLNFDGAGSDEVRRFFVDNALYWVTEYHVDALRLDAVHGIYDFGAVHILHEIADRVHAQAALLLRQVQVIAESDLNDPKLVRAPSRGGYGLDAQWSDDFHHAVHVALTGEQAGYYMGYHGVADVAKALARRFVYDGVYSPFRRRRHGARATDVGAEKFVVYIQNHDQVGNRAGGERLSTLVPFDTLKLAAALLLLSPYVPLLFMGEEYGETNPFLYFVSHTDPALVEAVRAGRAREFESFGWGDELPDPQAEETFLRSRLDRSEAEQPEQAALLAMYRRLLQLRRDEPALRPGGTRVRVTSDAALGVLTLALVPPRGRELLAAFNLSDEPRTLPLPAARDAHRWSCTFSTAQLSYGGAHSLPSALAATGDQGIQHAVLPPSTAALYTHEPATPC